MKKIYSAIFGIILCSVIGFGVNTVHSEVINNSVITPPSVPAAIQYTTVNALDVVATPGRYLKKNIRITGKFDKFTTLGLDYAPAMRSSEKYITFLIQRPDVKTHDIPLSELKIFLKKEVAEKNIDLDAGDEIEFTGRVFSSALGDAWMDVDEFKVLTQKSPKSVENNSK